MGYEIEEIELDRTLPHLFLKFVGRGHVSISAI